METGGADSHGDRGRAREKGRDLRERMSETLVPEAWAEAFSCWCQNVFLRACGQTEIKGGRAAEWHHTHTLACTHTIQWPLTVWFYNVTVIQCLQPP